MKGSIERQFASQVNGAKGGRPKKNFGTTDPLPAIKKEQKELAKQQAELQKRQRELDRQIKLQKQRR